MTRRHWKNLHPSSLPHAIELCLEHARAIHNRSVDTVADLMGLTNKWVLYKWMESGRLPANMIAPLQHACGIGYVTRWLAHAERKLLIDIPTGRTATAQDIQELQAAMHEAVGQLIHFYNGKADADQTVAAISAVMQDMAWHRHNVGKHAQPEFNLEDKS